MIFQSSPQSNVRCTHAHFEVSSAARSFHRGVVDRAISLLRSRFYREIMKCYTFYYLGLRICYYSLEPKAMAISVDNEKGHLTRKRKTSMSPVVFLDLRQFHSLFFFMKMRPSY